MSSDSPNPGAQSEKCSGEARDDAACADRESHGPPTETQEPTPLPGPAGVPKRIGHFRIKRAIASGGMGTVYEAFQEQPRRTVAVKLMRAGLTSRSALRRFEYESQLLARLRHTAIAQVYDAGTHQDGEVTVPYFAMEYIVGAKRITEFAKDKNLSARQRLKLFCDVCEAVHHGHQKGIIHRDLKPGNILVDSSGQVKIIDFGVARSTDSDMAVTTLQTDVGQLIGTLQYMSPEQCAADPHDIDTRSDVYALGVVLFELLCERLPYTIKGTVLHEAIRVIREQESTRLSTLNKTLRGDVETIVHKALEKDRDHRYQSASTLTEDIQRYLRDEPISARPRSMIYQLHILARRNKAAFVGAAAVFVAVLAGFIVSTVFYFKSESQRRQVDEERLSALVSERRAHRERDESIAATQRARVVTAELAKLVASLTPDNKGEEVARDVGKSLQEMPEIEAQIRAAMIRKYVTSGRLAEARQHIDSIMAIEPRQRRRSILGAVMAPAGNSANELQNQGRFAEEEVLRRITVEVNRRTLGEEHAQTLRAMNVLSNAIQNQGRYAETEKLCRRILAIRRRVLGDDQGVATVIHNVANTLIKQRRFTEAERFARESVAVHRATYGEESSHTTATQALLAEVLLRRGKLEEAEDLAQDALSAVRQTRESDSVSATWPIGTMAEVLLAKGEPAEAAVLAEEALKIAEAAYPRSHPDVGRLLIIFGECLTALGQYERAQSLLIEAYDNCKAVEGSSGYYAWLGSKDLVRLYEAWHKVDPERGYDAQAAEWRAKVPKEEAKGDE